MKYSTKDLHVCCFELKSYEDNDDKFLIGLVNKDNTKLKDVITGQIIDEKPFPCISSLKTPRDGGLQMGLGYMTERRLSNASPRQFILALYINSILCKDEIDEKQIAKIKQIMNKEIVKSHEKHVKKYKESTEENNINL